MATVVLYAVDLEEMRRWVGSGDATLVREGMAILREDEEADWEPEELALLERLLHRMVFDGRLYDSLPDEERYYLTQLLIDLFDELVESEPVSEEFPLPALMTALEPLRESGGPAGLAARWLTHGRLFGSDEVVWDGRVRIDDVLPYFAALSREEVTPLVAALESLLAASPGDTATTPVRRAEKRRSAPGSRPSARAAGPPQALLRDLHAACRAVLDTERDLLAFVG
jgi:hypothetical protein